MAIKKEKKKEECKDSYCATHGKCSIRGKRFKGVVKRIIGKRAVIEFERFTYMKKYERYAKSKTRLHAYISECLKDISVNDTVELGECSPINKIMRFIIIKKIK